MGPRDDPDRYALGPLVAAGAEGVLYRGSITRTGVEIDVAIKMLQPRFQDRLEELHEMWCDQLHLLRSVHTEGVVLVHEVFLGTLPHPPGEAGEGWTLYLIMSWVDGEPLDEWVRRRPDREPIATLKLLLPVASALDHMHSGHSTGVPVVHRDVKPANILVIGEGTVLVDFGLTRALPDGPRLSGVAGTLGYLAPEAVDEGSYTAATDRYALGGVAFFIFTGTDPPKSHQPETLRDSLRDVPALAGGSEALDHLMAMLDEDPDLRPQPLSNWVGQVRRSTLGDATGLPAAGIPRPQPAGSAIHRAKQLKDQLSKLADTLVVVESSQEIAVVRKHAEGGGPTAEAAHQIDGTFLELWLRFRLVEHLGDALAAAAASRRSGELERLLAPDAITEPSGATTSAASLVAELQQRAEEVAARSVQLIAGLERRRQEVLARLSVAGSELVAIERLLVEGEAARNEAIAKILHPTGLLVPLEPWCLDDGDEALRPSLAGIEGDVACGRWEAAEQALDRWSQAEADLRAEASRILAANLRPVAARDELRGRLSAYKAMAAIKGEAENPVLGRLHEEASDALYVAPCDLVSAQSKVQLFIDALTGIPASPA